jgi:hypothetical protein
VVRCAFHARREPWVATTISITCDTRSIDGGAPPTGGNSRSMRRQCRSAPRRMTSGKRFPVDTKGDRPPERPPSRSVGRGPRARARRRPYR